ncbi:hypothetical protein BSKO_03349 [Bryopsis sp. KO-2023]|nr:hypothetical protein BSKO_03349 [Bryopsis sp. KO-2023]
MPVICLGPVCIPLHLLLPFVLTWFHQRGYFTWFKREWLSFSHWQQKYKEWGEVATVAEEKELDELSPPQEPSSRETKQEAEGSFDKEGLHQRPGKTAEGKKTSDGS